MKKCGTRLIYRYTPPAQNGFRARFWGAAAGPNLYPGDWTGAPDFNSHPLPSAVAPIVDVVNSNSDVSDSNSGANEARYGIISGWMIVPDGATQIRDNNQNTGELGYVLIGDCCGNQFKGEGENDTSITSTPDRGMLDPTPVTAGQLIEWYAPQSDLSVFQGSNPEFLIGANWVDADLTQAFPELPSVECMELPVCDPIPDGWSLKAPKEPCQPRYTQGGDSNTDNQQLSISGDTISLTSGGSVTVTHPAPVAVPPQEICTGPFVDRTGRTGWVFPWTAVNTANTGTITDDWVQISSTETSPNCVTDLAAFVDAGEIYHQIKSARAYQWIDFRLLVNGVAVVTETYDNYRYMDDRHNNAATNSAPLKLIIENAKTWFAERYNVPAGAAISFEMRRRYNHNAFQTGGSVRTIGGLRSKAMAIYSPRQIVTGRQ